MQKVVKVPLICNQYNRNGDLVDYKDVYKLLWNIQKQTREIKNKTIQYCWEFYNFSSDYYKTSGLYPKDKDTLGYTLTGFIYDKFKTGNTDMHSSNSSTSIRDACAAFNNAKTDFMRGDKSIISYKSDQPIDLHNKCIKIQFKDNTFYIGLKLLNISAYKKLEYKNSEIGFKAVVKDNSTRTILQRCASCDYSITASKLTYNRKKKMWFLNLGYTFESSCNAILDPEKILGVDLGIHYPICASVKGDLKRFTIDGGEIEEFRRRIESRKLSLLKQGKYCGDGRKGHGIKTRNKPVYDIGNKIARARDTINHKYSRALIDYAVKNNCGVIQMEKLTGITQDSNKFMKNWSYFDLQTKIEYKAKEFGIKVIYINPKYTSQRCSVCGNIDRDNRPTQSKFICTNCGFTENADYNASQNISIKGIDSLIESSMKASAKVN